MSLAADSEGDIMDSVVIGVIIALAGTVLVFVFLGYIIYRNMNSQNDK